MVAAGTWKISCKGATQKWIGTASGRHVSSPLRHNLPLSRWQNTTAEASLSALAYHRPDRVRIQPDLQVIRLRTDIAQLKREVPGELALDREAPFLNGGRVQGRIHLPRRKNRARRALRWAATGRRRGAVEQRNLTQQRNCVRKSSIEGRVATESLVQVVLEGVVNPEAGAHGPAPRAGGVPSQAKARLK